MKKCILVDGYVRGKAAKKVIELLGVDSMYDVEEVSFSDCGADVHLVYEDDLESSLTTEEAFRGICGSDEIFEQVYTVGYDESKIIKLESPVVIKNQNGDEFKIIAAVLGMDEWGLDDYEA